MYDGYIDIHMNLLKLSINGDYIWKYYINICIREAHARNRRPITKNVLLNNIKILKKE